MRGRNEAFLNHAWYLGKTASSKCDRPGPPPITNVRKFVASQDIGGDERWLKWSHMADGVSQLASGAGFGLSPLCVQAARARKSRLLRPETSTQRLARSGGRMPADARRGARRLGQDAARLQLDRQLRCADSVAVAREDGRQAHRILVRCNRGTRAVGPRLRRRGARPVVGGHCRSSMSCAPCWMVSSRIRRIRRCWFSTMFIS